MRFIGFNFTKVDIEKFKDIQKDLKIQTTIDITDISDIKSDFLKSRDDVLEIKFLYGVKYEPGYAEIMIKGTILVSIDPKTAKEVLKGWKKKEMPEEFKYSVLNAAIRKAGLKALNLEDELNLPTHIPLPTLRKNQEK